MHAAYSTGWCITCIIEHVSAGSTIHHPRPPQSPPEGTCTYLFKKELDDILAQSQARELVPQVIRKLQSEGGGRLPT